MATITKYANAHTTITTGYTSYTNAYTDDTAYATAAPAKNAEVSAYWGFPAFTTSDIPDGSTINSVKVSHLFYVSVNTSIAEEYIQVFLNTTAQGTEQGNTAEPLSDTLLEHTVTSGITLTNLRTADVVRARTRSRRGNSNTAVTLYIDYVSITVDYTPKLSGSIDSAPSTNAVLKGRGKVIGNATPTITVSATIKGKGRILGVINTLVDTNAVLLAKFKISVTVNTDSSLQAILKAKGILIGNTNPNTLTVAVISYKSQTNNSNFFFLFS